MGHKTTNQKVVGSNPAGLTIENRHFLRKMAVFLFLFACSKHTLIYVYRR